MQGDIWDSQKDMFMAGLGAITAMIVIASVRAVRSRRRKEIVPKAAVAGVGYTDRYRPK
jgi:hypothetical protein